MIPLTNINPVVNHCTVEVEILKAFINVGNAVDRMVWLRTVQKVPTSNKTIIIVLLYGFPLTSTDLFNVKNLFSFLYLNSHAS
ncbi:hypothetical protein FD16_GL000881 [Paucilactobacillus suebicus DSM 5007 = KCTC 3549]|uniref:Uncharacterized protein n=1 Tax=Paucilactobacillus suebicus DSM 5007 = KCTC 3549 TaxID=1423807 RepID=A0A0R1W6F8_9LACO|nr:hypothetical protein FD16_GL000881 [Paucilactobacillus suebicus DSM 5007 = KCTC 3549]